MRSRTAGGSLVGLLLCAVLLSLACAGPAPAPSPAGPRPSGAAPAPAAPTTAPAPVAAPTAAPLTSLPLGYGAITGAHIPLWIAREIKAFEKYGLDVELVHLPGNTGPQSLIAGQVPVLSLAGFAVVPSMVEGAELVMISSAIQRQTAQVYGVPAIDSPQALRGRRLAITRPGTLTHFAALLALRDWGLKPEEDVALVSLNEVPSILAGLVGGAADAGILTEPTSFTAAKQGLRLLADLSDSPTEYLTSGLVTTRAYAEQNRPLLLGVLKAYLECMKRYFEDRELALAMLRQYARIEDPEILEQTYTLYAQKYLVKVPLPTPRSMQNILDDYALVNPRARDVDAARLVDATFVQELQRDGFFRSLNLE
jgi:ABC-type nitrate/sulfonate/bicarbonate transport system substrate-binding protein